MTTGQAIVTVLLLASLALNCVSLWLSMKTNELLKGASRNVTNMQAQQMPRFRGVVPNPDEGAGPVNRTRRPS